MRDWARLGSWLRLCDRSGWLWRRCWLSPCIVPREVLRRRQRWCWRWRRDGEAASWGFGRLRMVDVYRSPNHVVLIRHLVCIGDPFHLKGALPPWCQLTSTLWRSRHHEDEITFVVGVAGLRSWRESHLLVGEGESLFDHLNICDWVLCRRGGTCLVL